MPRDDRNNGQDRLTKMRPPWIVRQSRAHPRLFASIAIAIGAYFVFPADWSTGARTIAAIDTGAAVFLGLAWPMMWGATREQMQSRARNEDEGRWGVLTLAVAAGAASLLAIGFELHAARDLKGAGAAFHVALAAGTILLSWFFVHTNFALHYAHEYYGDRATKNGMESRGGLCFPDEESPDYLDFLYFSFVIGATCQVSDVQVTGRVLRRLVLAHGVLAFIFNTMILALAINIAAGLI